jgi:hypothetical protein
MTTHSLSVTPATAPLTWGAERKLQIALGLIWLLDGALQLQPFMFGRAFVTQIIAPNEIGQPGFVATPIELMAHLIEPRIVLFNLSAVTIQMLIGIGLIYRPTVKPALLASFGWALGVWWFGEGLGGLFTGTSSPLTGAPGAALLYVLAGLIAWPQTRPQTGTSRAGGVLGERGARIAWALLWLGSAALWLLPANRADAAVHDAIADAPSGARWLSSVHSTVAAATTGHGLAIALGAAGLSAAVGLAVLFGRCAKLAVALSAAIGLFYLVVGQGMGGVLTGSGTDPGTGPLIILLAVSIYPLYRSGRPLTMPARRRREHSQPPGHPSFVLDTSGSATNSRQTSP